jgi:hypothetical protein
MRRLAIALASLLAWPALASDPGRAVPRFEAKLQDDGKTVTVDSHRTARPTVYLFVGATCPTTARYLDRLRALEAAHAGKVDFIYLYPNANESPSQKAAFHAEKKLAGGMIDDAGAKIAGLLGARRTAEVFVVDAKHRIAYHGAIDDDREGRNVTRRHLALALDEVLAGKPVSRPTTDVHA